MTEKIETTNPVLFFLELKVLCHELVTDKLMLVIETDLFLKKIRCMYYFF